MMQIASDVRTHEQGVDTRRFVKAFVVQEAQVRRELHIDHTAENAAQELREAIERIDGRADFIAGDGDATKAGAQWFDEHRGVVTTRLGRVFDTDTDSPLPGSYATGWIKRGPSGVIGSNKRCAKETVDSLVEDLLDGRLAKPRTSGELLSAKLTERFVQVVGYDGWRSIDRHERLRGEQCGRPRVKLTRREDLLAYGRATWPERGESRDETPARTIAGTGDSVQ